MTPFYEAARQVLILKLRTLLGIIGLSSIATQNFIENQLMQGPDCFSKAYALQQPLLRAVQEAITAHIAQFFLHNPDRSVNPRMHTNMDLAEVASIRIRLQHKL